MLRARHAAPGIELVLTAAHIRFTADPRNNPLPSVATQVKHEVTGAVGLFVRAPPEVTVLKALKRRTHWRRRSGCPEASEVFVHQPVEPGGARTKLVKGQVTQRCRDRPLAVVHVPTVLFDVEQAGHNLTFGLALRHV